MEFIKEITVDLAGEMLFEYITAVQGDTGSRFVKVQLLSNRQPYTPPEGVTAVLRCKKPDGKTIFNDCTVGEDGTIKAELTEQMLAVAGNCRCEITLYGADESALTSVPFIVKVTSSAINPGSVTSADEFKVLEKALAKVEAVDGVANAALETATEALEKMEEVENSIDEHTTAAQNATEAANSATDKAYTAANAANIAKLNADEATQNAVIAAQGANASKDAANTAAGAANSGAASANNAANTANSAAEGANTAKTNANSAASAATTAADRANTAAIQAEAVVEQAGKLVTRYGVKFGGSANTGATVTKLYNAAGLVAGVGTDEQTAINDFDNIYPWSARRRCCGYWDDNGNFVVNAYKDEPGYIEDGTNGEVWVEHSLFFYKHEYSEDGAEEIVISATQLAGFLPAPIFLNADGTVFQKAYTAAFPLATVDGKATSRSGVFSDTCSLNSGMEKARTLGENYTVGTTAEWYTECLYMWVEFATRNLQNIMVGASSMPYTATDTATVAEDAANRIIVASAVAAKFVVGQTILIGTSLGSSNIANNRIVTAIEEYDAENKAIVFDGDPVNIAVGHIICTAAWINGSCNGVLSSSGSPVSNTNGKYNCVYRGKETPYGNAFEQIADVLTSRQGAGTAEDPYTYDVHFLPNPTQYSAGAITDDYIKLNFTVPGTDGYAKKLGYDSRFPWLRIPCELGASTTTYYSDCYYYPRSAVCAARVGGYWNNSSSDGPCFWSCSDAPSRSNVYSRARLSYHRT